MRTDSENRFSLGQYRWTIILLLASWIGFKSPVLGQSQSEAANIPVDSMQIPILTQEHMQEDFEYLIQTITDFFPAERLNSMVFGLHIGAKLREYQSRLPEIHKTTEFIRLVDKTLNACHGSHVDVYPIPVVPYQNLDWLRRYYGPRVGTESMRLTRIYHDRLRQYNESIKLNIPLFYFNGSYYVKHDFVHRNKIYLRGLKLVYCNGEAISDIVSKVQDERPLLPWDFENLQFYWTEFYKSSYFRDRHRLHMTFVDGQGKFVDVSFDKNEPVVVHEPTITQHPVVIYLFHEKTLFVRMPTMRTSDLDVVVASIKEKAQDHEIKRVVIDIRDNKGGSDWVWRKVIGMFMSSKRWRIPITLGIKDSEAVRNYVQRHDYGKTWRRWKQRQIDYLDDEQFLTLDHEVDIRRDEDFIGYRGKIFILVDGIYSSAGSMADVASKVDRVISVGRENPYILGAGIDPCVFTLPHSRLNYRIGSSLDFTFANSPYEVLHTNPEVSIDPTLEEMLEYYNAPRDDMEMFLLNSDPFMKRVLQLAEWKKDMLISSGISLFLMLLNGL